MKVPGGWTSSTTTIALAALVQKRIEDAALRPRPALTKRREVERAHCPPQEARPLEPADAIIGHLSGVDSLEPGHGLVAIDDEDGPARTHFLEIRAQVVLELGYCRLLHMAILARRA